MTLKELRNTKGLTQAQCAAYLGMSTRSYQNYENNAEKTKKARYHEIYQRLEAYGQPAPVPVPAKTLEFHTNVVTGPALQAMTNSVARATASAEKIRFMAYSLPARARSSQMQPTSMAA